MTTQTGRFVGYVYANSLSRIFRLDVRWKSFTHFSPTAFGSDSQWHATGCESAAEVSVRILLQPKPTPHLRPLQCQWNFAVPGGLEGAYPNESERPAKLF